jgi:hypothetical protein
LQSITAFQSTFPIVRHNIAVVRGRLRPAPLEFSRREQNTCMLLSFFAFAKCYFGNEVASVRIFWREVEFFVLSFFSDARAERSLSKT